MTRFLLFALSIFTYGMLTLFTAVSADASEARPIGKPIARKVLSVFSAKDDIGPRFTPAHLYLEAPLNHLGFDMHHHDLDTGLPTDLTDEFRAVVVWLNLGTVIKDADAWLSWLEKQLDAGKKVIILENIGLHEKFLEKPEGIARYNHFLYRLGIKDTNIWNSITYAAEIVKQDHQMIGFERPLPAALPPYSETLAIRGIGKSHLKVRASKQSEISSDLVITSQKGGYIAAGYAIFEGRPLLALKDKDQEDKKRAKPKSAEQNAAEELNLPTKSSRGRNLTAQEKYILEHRRNRSGKKGDVYNVKKDLKRQEDKDRLSVSNAAEKAISQQEEEEEEETAVQQWYVDPFLFLRTILDDKDEPKPDVTTLNGKRVFYSHIDGDGWNNISEIRRYKTKKIISSDVVRKEVLEQYPDIPVSVSVITSEMNEQCYGLPSSIEVARKIFALPHIEPSSHTHSHPLDWGVFDNNFDGNKKEIPLLHLYPKKPSEKKGLYSMLFAEEEGSSGLGSWAGFFEKHPELKSLLKQEGDADFQSLYYDTPRSFACEPYSTEQEIVGSIDIIKSLSPADKAPRLIQWSGNTSPYAGALRVTREAGFFNLNGGDSRYDNEYPSYSSVSPIGLNVENERQIYSSNSNENTYTNLWTDRFYGFRYLKTTVRNTESPIRIQPFNIYYHMYSGEKQASLNALKSNIDFARKQDIIPVMASEFAELANGFYTAKIIPLGADYWQIQNRGTLQTLRFDNALFKSVNMAKSKGVLGYNYFQGKLYVSLDPAAEAPEVALEKVKRFGSFSEEAMPYIISSRWKIKGLTFVNNLLTFEAQGYGQGKINIKMPFRGSKRIDVETSPIAPMHMEINKKLNFTTKTDKDGIAQINLAANQGNPVKVTIQLDN